MTAEQIVRALAAADPNVRGGWGGHRCAFCHAVRGIEDHRPDCPWRLAVEWVAAQEAQLAQDRRLYGTSFIEGGRRVDPTTIRPAWPEVQSEP